MAGQRLSEDDQAFLKNFRWWECAVSRHTPDGRQYRRQNREMLAGGPTCWRCGHPGADQGGHIIPASLAPDLAHDPANRRPEHGWRGCSTCGRKCNQEAGAKLGAVLSPRSRRW